MNHPRLSDAEREALQDEYSVMPAAISDEGISRQAGDSLAEIAKNAIKERDVAREALQELYERITWSPDCGMSSSDYEEMLERASAALEFRADGET